jgi:hypothetical protein
LFKFYLYFYKYLIITKLKVKKYITIKVKSYLFHFKTKIFFLYKLLNLKLKIKKITIQNIISNIFFLNCKIYLKNIFLVSSILNIKNNFLNLYSKINFFWEYIFILYYTIFSKNANPLAIYIAKNITDRKNHYFILNHFKILMFAIILYFKILGLRGIYFKIHGRFKGILKKKIYIIR